MTQEYDMIQEMNEQFIPEISEIMAKFAVSKDGKTKFMLMQQLAAHANSFMDYYDYCDPEFDN